MDELGSNSPEKCSAVPFNLFNPITLRESRQGDRDSVGELRQSRVILWNDLLQSYADRAFMRGNSRLRQT